MENNTILKLVFEILDKTEYFIESAILLVAAYNLDKNLESYNIGIDEYFEYEFLDMRCDFYKLGFEIENLSGGYKIYGRGIVVNVLIFKDIGDRLVYRHKDIKDRFKNNYILKKDLYPIKRYRYRDVLMKGPSEPYRYLKRVFNIRINRAKSTQ